MTVCASMTKALSKPVDLDDYAGDEWWQLSPAQAEVFGLELEDIPSLDRMMRSRPARENLLAAMHSFCLVLGLLSASHHARADALSTRRQLPEELAALRAAALVHALNADLLRNPSATLMLDRWCAEHHLAPSGSKIVAQRVRGEDKPADSSVRAVLHVGPEEPVVYRRVRLKCGEHVLSEADNWYVPAPLTPDMNRTLDTTDTSFGRVVAPLHFRRETLSAKLWGSMAPIGR